MSLCILRFMMLSHPLNKSFLAIITVIDWSHRRQLQMSELGIALVLMSDRLEMIKSGAKRITSSPSVKQGCNFKNIELDLKLIPTSNRILNVSHIQSLPVEILQMIFEILLKECQIDLSMASRACKRWNIIIHPMLIKHPQLYTKSAIETFLHFGNTLSWRYYPTKDKIISLSFGSSFKGSFLGDETVQGTDALMGAHSSLFRMIVKDRHLYPDVHPIFHKIVKTYPSIKYMKEIFFAKNSSGMALMNMDSRHRILRNGFSISDFVLSRIIRNVKRIENDTQWSSISLSRIQQVATFLLDLCESETNSLSKYIPKIIRHSRSIIHDQVKIIMNLLSGSLLLQVQYVTTSSQKLLDTYCMIYYEALDLCTILNVDRIKSIFDKAKSMESLYMYTREASCIYECIILIFQVHATPISESTHHTKFSDLDYDKLQTEISRFPPNRINAEICEILEHHLDTTPFPNPAWMDEDLVTLNKWRTWIFTVLKWFKSSKQMEPVKELLRGNMSKIDQLRGLQVI